MDAKDYEAKVNEILRATNDLSDDDAIVFISALAVASLSFLNAWQGREFCETLAKDILDGKLGTLKTFTKQ